MDLMNYFLHFISLIALIKNTTTIKNYVEFVGYESLISNKTLTSHLHEIQQDRKSLVEAMTEIQQSLKKGKLPSISLNVPILDHDTTRMWKFQLETNTRYCSGKLAKYIFDNPAKQASDDIKSAGEKTQEEKEFDVFKEEFEKDEDNKMLLGHAHVHILHTLQHHDKQNVTNIPYARPDLLYAYLTAEYNVNTRATRAKKFVEFFMMSMEPEEKFSHSVNRIDTEAAEINSKAGA